MNHPPTAVDGIPSSLKWMFVGLAMNDPRTSRAQSSSPNGALFHDKESYDRPNCHACLAGINTDT